MNNPGKYDEACTVARMMCEADAVLLLVLNGKLGQGFSAQCPPEMVPHIPALLRRVAFRIEEDPDHIATVYDLTKPQKESDPS